MADCIERDAFLDDRRAIYCADCGRRKGMRNGKMKTLYAIGDVPCRSCGIGDVLDDVENWPAANVVERKWGIWEERIVTPTKGNVDMLQSVRCSACGVYHTTPYEHFVTTRYCPNCGAEMCGH